MINRQFVIQQFANNLASATAMYSSPVPTPGPGQVLIRNKFVGINALYDRELYRGRVPYIKVDFPFVFGVEAVGEVVALGPEVDQYEIGQSVGTVKVGTAYQEYQVADAATIIPIPAATAEYLTLSPTGVSAYLAVEKTGELQAGELVVVSAAAGGLGHIIVQLAKLRACKVVAICGSATKVELLRELDCCDRIINYREEDLKQVLTTEFADKIDVAFDSVGRQVFDAFLPNMAPLGRLVVCGLAAELSDLKFEKVIQPRVYEQLYWKGASVRCFMNHLYRSEHARARDHLFQMYNSSTIKVRVDSTPFRGIEGIAEASEYLLAGRSCGKVVVAL